jgi:hypothetical protein
MGSDFQMRVLPQLHGIFRKFGTAIPPLRDTVRIEQGKKNSGQDDRESEMLLPWPDFRTNTISAHRYKVCLCPRPCVTSAALSLTDFSARMEVHFPNEVYERL